MAGRNERTTCSLHDRAQSGHVTFYKKNLYCLYGIQVVQFPLNEEIRYNF